tara:strand:+ start:326 stop:619 length:294 start_codon:yes stop_codon:yes gene_type:complete
LPAQIKERFITNKSLILAKRDDTMLVFGVDVPLIEIVIAFVVVIFVILAESIIVVMLIIKQLGKTKKLAELTEKLSETILQIKKAEIEELDRLRGRK